ncbi:MAG TPA: type II toxin-antitoxin system HicB family antitoxin [Stellaceae bacterium]|jgi:predicted RNase H-like HicB family nuclease|nr:type II toxin-antitoxin system HicB family antitoxin [Stellaceae bacterium]
MSAIYFPAIVEGGKKAGFSVYFPDLPGLASAGRTVQEAALKAEEALQFHLGGMLEDGEKLPEPSNLDRLSRDPAVKEVARILVRAELPSTKALRLNVTLPEDLVLRIDAFADNRSRFLAEAAERALPERHRARRKTGG